MVPFIILLTVPIAISPFVKDTTINGYPLKRIPLFLFFLMLTLLIAFRHETVGNDTEGYIYYFKETAYANWNQITWGSMENGYQLYMKLVSLITKDPRFFLILTSVLVSLMIYPTYSRVCTDAPLTMVIFCSMPIFTMSFSGVRQMMAIGIGFIAYELCRRRKLFFFLITVFLAMQFHTSAFILFLMYPVYHLRITKRKLVIIVPIIALIFIFNKQVFTLIGPLLGTITKFDYKIAETGAYTSLFLFLIFSVFSFLIPEEEDLDEETIGLRNMLLLSLVIQMFTPIHGLVMRTNYYYIIFIPLLLPKIIQYRSVRWNQFAVTGRYVMVAFFFAYFLYKGYFSPINLHVFPYHAFWETVV